MDRNVRVTLSLIATGYTSGMAGAKAATDSLAKSAEGLSKSQAAALKAEQEQARAAQLAAAQRKQAFAEIGTAATVAGAAILAGVGVSVKAAMDWESAFAGVKKTIDGTPQQIAQIEGELRGMARTMATSHEEIAAVAEAAGQLGVATADVSSFTRTMVMLGESTNLSADAAATSMAQFMNIMGTAPNKVGRLAATLVDLGNKGASTESQILELSQRLSGAANQVCITEQATMGFASAIASTGMNVEAGGTAMSKVFLKLQSAVEAGGDKLALLSKVAGTDFATAFETDAARATLAFVEGLGKMQASGESVSGVLGDLGLKGQYERDTLMRLAGATKAAGGEMDLLRYNLDNANESFNSGGALIAEYAQRAGTAESRVKVAFNNIKDAAITAGSSGLVAVKGFADGLSAVASVVGAIPAPIQGVGMAIAAVAGAALLGVGGVIKFAQTASQLKESLATVGITSDVLKSRLGGIPWGKVALGAGIAIAGITAVTLAMDAFSKSATSGLQSQEEVAQGFAIMGKAGTGLAPATMQIDKMNQALDNMGLIQVDGIGGLFKAIGDGARNGLGGVQELADGFLGMRSAAGIMRDEVNKMDGALTGLVKEGGLSSAQVAFTKISDASMLAGESLEFTAAQFPQYKAQLETTAQALGVTTLSATDFANWMRGEVPPAITEVINAGGDMVSNLTEQQKAFTQTTTAAERQAAAMRENADAAAKATQGWAGVIGSQSAMEDAFDKAAGAIKENGKTLDVNTEKGRGNLAVLTGLATATASYVQTLVKSGAPMAEIDAAWTRGREQFIAAAKAMGATAEEAANLADQAQLIPNEVTVLFNTPGADVSVAQAEAMKHAAETIPKIAETSILAKDARPSKQAVDDFVASIGQVPGLTTAEVRTMADLYGVETAKKLLSEMPLTVNTNITATGALEAAQQAQSFATVIQGIPGVTEAIIATPGATLSKEQADAVNAALMRIPGVTEAELLTPGAPLSKRQTEEVIAALGRVPGVVMSNVSTPGAVDSKMRADQVRAALHGIPGLTKAQIDTIAQLGGVYSAKNAINSVNSKTVYVNVVHRSIGGANIAVADGGIMTPSSRGLVQAYSSGGIHGSFAGAKPQIRSAGGGGVMWAEEGAGPWEAFISGHPGKRMRSRWILGQVARMLGGQVVYDSERFADGGVKFAPSYTPPAMPVKSGGKSSASLNTAALAAAVEQAINGATIRFGSVDPITHHIEGQLVTKIRRQ